MIAFLLLGFLHACTKSGFCSNHTDHQDKQESTILVIGDTQSYQC